MSTDGPASPREVFAERLRSARRARGFRTAKSFALRLGIDQNTYTRYERGEVEPNIALIERIWAALDLPPSDLFGASGARLIGLSEAPDRLQRGLPPVSPREALAWRVATVHVRATPIDSHEIGDHEPLQRIGRLFLELLSDPFRVLARLADDPALAGADREVLAELKEQVDLLALQLAYDTAASPRASLKRPRRTTE